MSSARTFNLAATLPFHDWQFWVVTAVFLFAAAWILRGVLPLPILTRRKHRLRTTTKATLTIGGKPPARK